MAAVPEYVRTTISKVEPLLEALSAASGAPALEYREGSAVVSGPETGYSLNIRAHTNTENQNAITGAVDAVNRAIGESIIVDSQDRAITFDVKSARMDEVIGFLQTLAEARSDPNSFATAAGPSAAGTHRVRD